MSDVIEQMRGGLVVSVQAPGGSPLAEPQIMAALAKAAELGGAVGIRAEGGADIAAIKAAVMRVPVIGLRKRRVEGYDVYITPELSDAHEVVAAGADVIAVDATVRERPGHERAVDFLLELVAEIEHVPVLADVDSLDAALTARDAGAHAVATTLAGYTAEPVPEGPDIELVHELAAHLDCPVIAEGRYGTPDEVRAAFEAGAHAVVVGTAITDPTAITRRLAGAAPRGGR